MRDLDLYSNEELLELAHQRHLIDVYHRSDASIVLFLDGKKLILSPSRARTFLAGLLWGSRDMGERRW